MMIGDGFELVIAEGEDDRVGGGAIFGGHDFICTNLLEVAN
jgi:hypothetical protein